jgi:hypothetical protein
MAKAIKDKLKADRQYSQTLRKLLQINKGLKGMKEIKQIKDINE